MSSLESFWKWWHLVLKQETASELSKDIIASAGCEYIIYLLLWSNKERPLTKELFGRCLDNINFTSAEQQPLQHSASLVM